MYCYIYGKKWKKLYIFYIFFLIKMSSIKKIYKFARFFSGKCDLFPGTLVRKTPITKH